MDKGRRKRIADIAEKLGIGLLLGTVARGIFVKEMALFSYVAGTGAIITGPTLIIAPISLSRED